MKYLLLLVFLLSGCSVWTNFIHEREQEKYRQELACEKQGGVYEYSVYFTKESDCNLKEKQNVEHN